MKPDTQQMNVALLRNAEWIRALSVDMRNRQGLRNALSIIAQVMAAKIKHNICAPIYRDTLLERHRICVCYQRPVAFYKGPQWRSWGE